MKKLKSDDTMDRLSELPDALILKILSSLDKRDVVRTTLLSKRWNNLWTTIPCLRFANYNDSYENMVNIRNFINRALLLWKGTKIQKFEIYMYNMFDESLYHDMNWWLPFVMEKNVEELYLSLPGYCKFGRLPHCLYECSSIRKLSLVDDQDLSSICGDVHWDQLKSLTIVCYDAVREDVINQLLSGAPQLESFELTFTSDELYGHVNLSIQSSSLKKLSIHLEPFGIEDFDPSFYGMLTIWAPNLETLIMSGCPYSKCLLTDVSSSLTDATLDFKDAWDVVLGGTLRQILPNFQHVEKLTLSSWCFKVLAVMKGKDSFSPLSNVKLLRLTHHSLFKSNEIVVLLEIFPRLKMLGISERFMVYELDYPVKILSKQDIGEPLNSEVDTNTIKSLMMQLRIVEIGWEEYEKSMFEFIEFFLEHATMLEKIVIRNRECRNVQAGDMILAAEKLLSLQRSFPTVKLIFCKERY